jgi:hypothetical protein
MKMKVALKHKQVDGAHFFTSPEKKPLGLCVAHTDLETAKSGAVMVIDILLKENHGIQDYPLSDILSAVEDAAVSA